MTFHFDIDVVKNHVRTIERSQGYDESISKASSSTISTQSTTNQQKYRIANRNVGPSHSKKVSSVQDIFGDFSLQRCEDIWKSHDNDGWTTPIFFNETDNVEKGRNENSWINFAPDSFAPIETTSQNNSFTDINTAPISDSMMTALSSHKARYGTPKTVETDNTYPVREHPKPIHMHPKKFKQEKPHSLSKPINPGISPHSGIHEKTIQEVRKQEPLSKTDVTKPEMSNKTNVSDMQTNASTPKVGKLKQNSHVLNDFLQKKMGDGSTAKPTSNNHGINHQKGQNIQFQDTKTNALLSTMLQKKLASKETSASKPLQKSQIQGETIQSKDTSVLSRILQNRKAGNDTTATLSPKKPQGTLKNVNVVSAPELPCTKSLTMCSDDVTDVEWDDLSGTAFIAALNADEGHAKYSKMLQVGLPIPVVKNAMQRDGIVMRSAKKTTTPAESESNQRFRVQWTVHDNVRCNTLWAMIQRERHWLSNVVLDEEELASWFQKPTVTRTESVRVEPKPQRGIIDPKRANNCGILLATIKMRYAEIARVIDHYDMPALTLTQMHGLWQCLPTAEEAAALQQSGAVPDKSECERFMLEMMRVKNAKVKLEAMLFLKRLPTRLGELQHGTLLVDAHFDNECFEPHTFWCRFRSTPPSRGRDYDIFHLAQNPGPRLALGPSRTGRQWSRSARHYSRVAGPIAPRQVQRPRFLFGMCGALVATPRAVEGPSRVCPDAAALRGHFLDGIATRNQRIASDRGRNGRSTTLDGRSNTITTRDGGVGAVHRERLGSIDAFLWRRRAAGL